MPRVRRSNTQAPGDSSGPDEQQATVPMESMDENSSSSRPKRARKQTQRFSNASATTGSIKTTRSKKRVADKGKRKARPSDQEELVNPAESAGTVEDEPPRKKARSKKESTPKEEKRLAQFKSHCPQKTLERAERVRTQRFFMVDRRRAGKELKEEFKVLGSTANVYTVTIDHKPKCDCPDNRMGNHCKHIMFIFLKVLCVPIKSHIWYQKALLTSELESVFSSAPEAPNSVTNPRVREAFLRATGQLAESSSAITNSKKRIPGEEDDCPICYDTMFGVAEIGLAFCEECGNALHKECFVQYEKNARQTGKTITCVWCRSEWGMQGPAKPTGSATQRGAFVNLAGAVPEIDGRRDTSSYYHGPRQGQHYYGYNYYGDSV
ncbi:hypothetical protein D9756_001165 [Leucocoprinus leucothites]|uniref:SWIM-type domain-containing protein n=1 Tax=Leucocoprinus leucothites TaxID=201217 RepID=A0A8H5LHX5_9AGAR|nr:hypothetical protein D9756_001165 [Leucoagaricus leucothites]